VKKAVTLGVLSLILVVGFFSWGHRDSAQSKAEVVRRLPGWVHAEDFVWFSSKNSDDILGPCTYAIIDIEVDTIAAHAQAEAGDNQLAEWRSFVEQGGYKGRNKTNTSIFLDVFHWLPSRYYVFGNRSLTQALDELSSDIDDDYMYDVAVTVGKTDNCSPPPESEDDLLYFVDLFKLKFDYVLVDISRHGSIIAAVKDDRFYYFGP
jgi:hypothetical protein